MTIPTTDSAIETAHHIAELTGAKKRGNGWQGHCPGHDDQNASLSFSVSADGHVLLKDFGGCDFETVANALEAQGILKASLFPADKPKNGNGRASKSQVGKLGKVVASFDYHSADGQLVYSVDRLEPARDGGRKEFMPRLPGSKKYGLPGDVDRVLYHLPDVMASDEVDFAEGEAKADVLIDMGRSGTCITGGVNGRLPADLVEVLTGKAVNLFPDNDAAGRAFMESIAGMIGGYAKSVKIIHLPGLAEKGDIVNWRAAGGTTRDLQVLIRDTPEWQPSTADVQPVQLDNAWRLIPASEVKQRPPVRWLIKGKVAEGNITVLFGDPGAGKSFITQDWAEQIARTGPVVYVAAEGSYQDRLLAWEKHKHAESGLHFFEAPLQLINDGQVIQFINLVYPMAPKAIIFDTLAWVMGGDENSTEDMQKLMTACRQIARQTGAAIILVHHTNKMGGYRGNSALKGAADVMLEIQNDDGRLKLTCEKSKNAADSAPEYYQLLTIETRIDTDGEPVTSCVIEPAEKVIWTKDSPLTANQRAVLDELSKPIFEAPGCRVKDLAEILKLSRSSLYNALNTLKRAGYVRQAESGDPFYITDEGKRVQSSPKSVQLDTETLV